MTEGRRIASEKLTPRARLAEHTEAARKIIREAGQPLSPADARELMATLKQNMREDPGFYSQLEPFRTTGQSRMREMEFKGKTVLVKDCGIPYYKERKPGRMQYTTSTNWREGTRYRTQYLRFYKKYLAAIRNKMISPNNYLLVPIAAYGRIKAMKADGFDYLVMQEVKTLPNNAWDKNAHAIRAFDEMKEDLKKIEGLKPQHRIFDVLVLGNTNPQNPEKGKWIFALPHDY